MSRRSSTQNTGAKKTENEFEEMHITWIWEELQERYGFPLREWKKRFTEHLAKQPGESDITGVFLRFGYDNINPILNQILCRKEGYPTWNNGCISNCRGCLVNL